MTFPLLPEDIESLDLNPDQIAFLLLASIAFEELGLAHLINAEAETIQAVLGTLVDSDENQVNEDIVATSFEELLEANSSVEKVLKTIIKKEMLLQFKFENVLEFLNQVTTTAPPVTTTGAPVTTTGAPVTTTGAPVTTTSAPTDICTGACRIDPLVDVRVETSSPATQSVTNANICDNCNEEGNLFSFVFNDIGASRIASVVGLPETFVIDCNDDNTILTLSGLAFAVIQQPPNPNVPFIGEVPFTATFNETTQTLTVLADLPAPRPDFTATVTFPAGTIVVSPCD
ncbi:hypothetical protein ACFSO7_04455 [Bacillus sp. CGMCC 1.16607]|uniref:hypothetical protein n=1 Tax=Bacillus sp. CGMCC 1.16607 TaxID=3351842 RepID=UPI0036322272